MREGKPCVYQFPERPALVVRGAFSRVDKKKKNPPSISELTEQTAIGSQPDLGNQKLVGLTKSACSFRRYLFVRPAEEEGEKASALSGGRQLTTA